MKFLVEVKSKLTSLHSPAPFIVGVGRSGTTLLRMMLDAHPELSIPPETHFITRLLNPKVNLNSLEEFMRIVTKSGFWNDFGLCENSFRNKLSHLSIFNGADGLRCFFKSYSQRFGKTRWGDKTPHYILNMQSISALLPEARFIHVIRDGRDVSLSYKGLWFGPGDNVINQAKFWVERICSARKQASSLSNYLEIRYEDLLKNTEDVLKNICNYIEINYSKKMEEYYVGALERISELKDRLDSNGNILINKEKRISIFPLVSKEIDLSRIERWKHEMQKEDQEKYELIAGSFLRQLGYETFFQKDQNTENAIGLKIG